MAVHGKMLSILMGFRFWPKHWSHWQMMSPTKNRILSCWFVRTVAYGSDCFKVLRQFHRVSHVGHVNFVSSRQRTGISTGGDLIPETFGLIPHWWGPISISEDLEYHRMGKLLSQTYAISFKLSTFRYLKYLEIKAQYLVASTILVFSLVLRARETQALVADTHVGIDPRTQTCFWVVVVQCATRHSEFSFVSTSRLRPSASDQSSFQNGTSQ